MKKTLLQLITTVGILIIFNSCGGHYRHVLFQDEKDGVKLYAPLKEAERNYILKPYDKFSIKVYTNDGELVIDPNMQFSKSMGIAQQNIQVQNVVFEVRPNGTTYLPIVGSIKVSGYSISQLDSLLNIEFEKTSYNGAYVITTIENNRVVVLGGTQGGQVIPLTNNNMNLIEVLAIYGGIPKYSKSNNIRLIRGDLKNPQVEIIDLSTLEGMQKANLGVQPNDIIYIEPVKRLLPETVAEISPILSFFTTIITLAFVITN